MVHQRTRPGHSTCSLIAFLSVAALAGCVENPMTMNGNFKGDLNGTLKGDLVTTVRLAEPIQLQMQMQGPTIRYEGTYISDELVERIQVGKTTDDWIVAVLGEPTAKAELRDGTEVWRWVYRPVTQEASVIEVFAKDEKEPKLATRVVFVQLRGGVVIDKWKG